MKDLIKYLKNKDIPIFEYSINNHNTDIRPYLISGTKVDYRGDFHYVHSIINDLNIVICDMEDFNNQYAKFTAVNIRDISVYIPCVCVNNIKPLIKIE